MAKFPGSPGVAALRRIDPSTTTIAAGRRLARIYYSRGEHPVRWNEFRHYGPVNARWDHHLPDANGAPKAQGRSVYYAASDAKTCLAEFFQTTRRIDRARQAPWLVVFELTRPFELLDVTGDFATRMGASMAIHSGSRARARSWARDLYVAFPEAQGVLYCSSMNAGQPAIALNDRAEKVDPFPRHPLFNRALADDVMLDPLKHAAAKLGYALR